MEKTGLQRMVNVFSVDFNPIETNDIVDIHKYLMKGNQYEISLELLKKYLLYY